MAEVGQRQRGMSMVLAGAVGSAAVGLLVSWLFDIQGRGQVFLVVLFAGVYGLMAVRRASLRKSYEGQLVRVPQDGSLSVMPEAAVERLLKGQGKLASDEARQWLDDFLLEQQQPPL